MNDFEEDASIVQTGLLSQILSGGLPSLGVW